MFTVVTYAWQDSWVIFTLFFTLSQFQFLMINMYYVDRYIDRQNDRWKMGGWIDGLKEGWTDGRTVGRMDGWARESLQSSKDNRIIACFLVDQRLQIQMPRGSENKERSSQCDQINKEPYRVCRICVSRLKGFLPLTSKPLRYGRLRSLLLTNSDFPRSTRNLDFSFGVGGTSSLLFLNVDSESKLVKTLCMGCLGGSVS